MYGSVYQIAVSNVGDLQHGRLCVQVWSLYFCDSADSLWQMLKLVRVTPVIAYIPTKRCYIWRQNSVTKIDITIQLCTSVWLPIPCGHNCIEYIESCCRYTLLSLGYWSFVYHYIFKFAQNILKRLKVTQSTFKHVSIFGSLENKISLTIPTIYHPVGETIFIFPYTIFKPAFPKP